MKKIFTKSLLSVSFLCLLFSLLLTPFAQAQVVGCAQIPVGAPPANSTQQPPAGCSGGGGAVNSSCGSVVDKDNEINAKLAIGTHNSLYSLLTSPVTSTCGSTTPRSSWYQDKYWCTYSVIDAYNIAGISGLSTGNASTVIEMHKYFMKQQGGYIYVEYEKANDKIAALSNVHPGYAMMMETGYLDDSQEAHVGVVTSIAVDPHGNGSIQTDESNAGSPKYTYPIKSGIIQNTPYPVAAFGGH